MGPGEGVNEKDELFYDGGCGLCHGAVRFILNRGEKGEAFHFAPLGGSTYHQKLTSEDLAGMPDSLVILTVSGEVLSRSMAVFHVLDTLGGGWRLLGRIGQILPRSLTDALYGCIASIRHRLTVIPVDVCPGASEEQREGFDD